MSGWLFSLEIIDRESSLISHVAPLDNFSGPSFMSSFFLIFFATQRDSSKMQRFILVNRRYVALSLSLSFLADCFPDALIAFLFHAVVAKSEVTVKILISPALFRGAAVYLGYSPLSGFMVLYTLYFIFYSVHILSLSFPVSLSLRSSPPCFLLDAIACRTRRSFLRESTDIMPLAYSGSPASPRLGQHSFHAFSPFLSFYSFLFLFNLA